ncbi:hypothetical protein [Nocardioides sp.]|uniref:hypothetical protein n=1 Tax=Nocardioides sp. TaxID=35761 RepID=UPI002F3F53CD
MPDDVAKAAYLVVQEGLGLQGMRTRVERLGGVLRVGRRPAASRSWRRSRWAAESVIRVAVVDDQALVRTGLRTLGARDRAQLVVFAIRSGLEPPPSDG